MKHKNVLPYAGCILATALVLTLAICGPQWLAEYRDAQTLDQKVLTASAAAESAYRYELNVNERVYLLSMALDSQNSTYALVENSQTVPEGELTEEEIFSVCNAQMLELYDCGVLPDEMKETGGDDYDAVRYSAIDILEPSSNLSVWKLSLSTSRLTTDKDRRAIDVYLDAETGRIYEFYVRCGKGTTWESLDPDAIAANWATYLDLTGQQEYPSDSTLLENTQYYQKYLFTGFEDTATVVTVGFYDGINELFVKVE